MLPALFVATHDGATGAAYGSYSRWVRAQLRVPADDAIEAALIRASETRPTSLHAYVKAFVHAYEASASERPIALAFTEQDLSNDALITYLQRRLMEIGDEGLLPRTFFTSLSSRVAGVDHGGAAALSLRRKTITEIPDTRLRELVSSDPIAVLIRTLSSARPLGP